MKQSGEDDSRHEDDNEGSLAAKETSRINILRFLVFTLLLSFAVLASVGVFVHAKNRENRKFQEDYNTNAERIMESFQQTVEIKLGAMNALANAITSHALSSGESFPRVTLPHFEVHAGNARIAAEAPLLQWAPLVTDETRAEWEEYALAQRGQVDESYENEKRLRDQQDDLFGLSLSYNTSLSPRIHPNDTILDDGTNFHPRIWSNGAVTPRGDAEIGPFLPLWQRSPVCSRKQNMLNFNLATAITMHGGLEPLLETREAVMNRAEAPRTGTAGVQGVLEASQYREESRDMEYLGDPHTFFAYPIFNSFDEDRQVAGVIMANTYWRMVFANVLPADAKGYICILENSFNQTLTYQVDGKRAIYLGEEDSHNSRFDYLERFESINESVSKQSSVKTRSFTTVPLNKEYGQYTLRIYPSEVTEAAFLTNKSWVYTAAVFLVFLVTVIIFVVLDRIVARRQKIIMDRVVKAAEEKAAFEHELNAFLAHEVRNPVAAAIAAHGFVVSSVNDLLKTPATSEHTDLLTSLKADVKVIGSSLYFIDDFLRSILDIHASMAKKLEVQLAPTDLLTDVLEPVQSMLCQRDGRIDVSVHCPDDLVVMTDCLRLKQIMMNLGRNSLKFTTSGFVCFRAVVENGLVKLLVEDSGAGIPEEKRMNLFARFQSSLDVLSQGTGIGLSLCEQLVVLLKGNIYLDENYDSGVTESPGSRFVVQLNQPCLPSESILSRSEQLSAVEFNQNVSDTGSPSSSSSLPSELPDNLAVLFVDDDNVLRKLFCRAVKKAAPSWSVAEAASGEAALQLVESDNAVTYNIIFMDQYMASTEKQMLGTETVAELRNRGIDCTICGLSANNMEESFLTAGADAFLLKPFPCDPMRMQQELARIIQSRSSV